MDTELRQQLAQLPQIEVLLRHHAAADAVTLYGRQRFTDALRAEVQDARRRVRQGAGPPSAQQIVTRATHRLADQGRGGLRRVINATGVVLHTNLGRAPLSAEARRAVLEASGYTTVEYELDTGRRGSRTRYLASMAADLCRTESATVVNNGAAALVLVLAALATGRQVVVSRGELIEIGGSYRLPEMMSAAGCELIEVGTTNRTRIGDYAAAITEHTAMLLKVHRSNFEIRGFTEEATAAELAGLARRHGVSFVHDVGSGLLRGIARGPLAGEPAVDASVDAGCDLVVFSGDKLLGGPQAGIVAGRAELVERCRRHPLARAVRVDKLQRAALEATFAAHLRAEQPLDVPTVAMLAADESELRDRAERLAERLGRADVRAVDAVVGGGSVPGVTLPSWAVALEGDVDELAAALRAGDPPVVARIERDAILLDLRAVPPSQDGELAELVELARGAPNDAGDGSHGR